MLGRDRHWDSMVKPNTTSTQSTTTPKPPAVEIAKSAEADGPKAESAPDASGEPATEPKAAASSNKRDKGEKRHPYTVQLSPTVWRRAKLLASLTGTTVSRMVEADLVKRIGTELKSLVEGLDKIDE